MNEITKHQIIDNIEKNAQNYENSYKKDSIIKFLNDSLDEIKNNFIIPMNNSINNYGIDVYQNNLNAKINQKTLRMLQNNENENLYEKKVADKSIDETFHKLLNNSNNTNNFLKTFEKFEIFENNLQKNIENLNIAYKNSKNLIKKNEYEEEIEQLITNKLEHLNNLTSDYYTQINAKYLQTKNYLKSSIEEIDNLLNLCAKKTFSVFVDKYNEISNLTQNKDNVQEEHRAAHNQKENRLPMENVVGRVDKFLRRQEHVDTTRHHEHQSPREIALVPYENRKPRTCDHGDNADDNFDTHKNALDFASTLPTILASSLVLILFFIRRHVQIPLKVYSEYDVVTE